MDTDYIGKWYDDGEDPKDLTEFVETCVAVMDAPDEFDFTVDDLLDAVSDSMPPEYASFFVYLALAAREA